ncbi:MAG: Unknown protein [uncultured Sulfurovum sp.]|uniref:Glycosyltransferase 2-like domain-containing protein n=2 Tax=uncultured Sulfurovum sp. TaxID=269237 RepID=A0A6S6TMW1_9BACT|nr:MAG: Unknown protein [uncultured Sulfurovum sp.]
MKNKFIDLAIVTVFNPANTIVNNIKSYVNHVTELLIVDNSIKPYDFTELQNEFSYIRIISTNKNLGIAKALNMGLEYASSKGYKWLLTMDQDSYFEDNEIEKFIYFFRKTSTTRLAIFSPLHNKKFKKNSKKIYNSKKIAVMTSGNIISVEIALRIGGFDENFFIDEVDHDFCLRLMGNDYRIIQNYNTHLNHTLGEKHISKNINLYSSNRLYYMLRNYLYLKHKNKHKNNLIFFKERDKYLFKFFIKQVFYGYGNKVTSLKMLYRGYKDYKKNLMGYRIVL